MPAHRARLPAPPPVPSPEPGVGVRAGRFCAHPLVDRLAGTVGGCAVRASLGLGTSAAVVDRLVEGVRALVAHGPGWDYGLVDGRWTPLPDPRPADPLGLGTGPAAGRPCGS